MYNYEELNKIYEKIFYITNNIISLEKFDREYKHGKIKNEVIFRYNNSESVHRVSTDVQKEMSKKLLKIYKNELSSLIKQADRIALNLIERGDL